MTASTAAAPQHHRKALWLILPFLWPRDDPRLKLWLVGAIVVLIATAFVSAGAPLLLADAIDRLEPIVGKDKAASVATLAIVGLLVGYGVMHWLARVLNELRWLIYGRVEQRTRRRVGLVVFRHLHALSLRFHLARRTGSISHILDNGMRGIEDLLFDCIFLILPLAAQIVIIAGIMLARFDSLFAIVIVVVLVLYMSALIIGSEWLRKHQRRAVVVGTRAQGMAIDSLLNYETIKFSANEEYVAAR
jgi:ATP-binding cassette subfamily B protein